MGVKILQVISGDEPHFTLSISVVTLSILLFWPFFWWKLPVKNRFFLVNQSKAMFMMILLLLPGRWSSSKKRYASKPKRYLTSMFLEICSPYKHVLGTLFKIKNQFPSLYSTACFFCHYGISNINNLLQNRQSFLLRANFP